jgi:DNA-binding response OmpR family regulator
MRVLVVEDDARLRAILTQALSEQGIAVESAQDGPRGLEMALSRPVDAIVLDVMLPGMDGFAVLAGLRRARVTAPVLMLTARAAVEDRVRGLDLGADDYLPKPFDVQELLARLRALMRRPGGERSVVLRVADLEVDPAAHAVRRAGRPIDLTAKEFALLEYLARNKGIVVTKGMLLDRVWGLDHDGGSNLVAVYVNYLRRKIDDGFEPKLLHTIRGAGYVMRESP